MCLSPSLSLLSHQIKSLFLGVESVGQAESHDFSPGSVNDIIYNEKQWQHTKHMACLRLNYICNVIHCCLTLDADTGSSECRLRLHIYQLRGHRRLRVFTLKMLLESLGVWHLCLFRTSSHTPLHSTLSKQKLKKTTCLLCESYQYKCIDPPCRQDMCGWVLL